MSTRIQTALATRLAMDDTPVARKRVELTDPPRGREGAGRPTPTRPFPEVILGGGLGLLDLGACMT